MPFGAQTGELFSVFDRLDPDDANITVPTVDPSSITPVFPIDPAWLGLNTIALRSANQSISGATGDFSDTDNSEFTNQFPPLGSVRHFNADPIQSAVRRKDPHWWGNHAPVGDRSMGLSRDYSV